jgi:DNA-binding SARP family transcriptional activator
VIEFRILGPLEVWNAGQRIAVGGPKQRRVLAVLSVEPGRVVPVERLVDAIWDVEPPSTARKQVQNAVSALRQTPIGAVLLAQGPGYLLRVSPDQVDAQRFEGYLAQARRARAQRDLDVAAEALHAGLALWRGPALAGVGGRFAATAGAHLEERRLSAVTEWAQIALKLGRHTAVADELITVVDEHPLREPLTGLLMLALQRSGRTAEALVRYHRIRKALAEDLGIDPGSELRTLYDQILATDPALDHQPIAPVGRNDLPRDIAYFTGRSVELERLTSIVDSGGTIVIQAIDGMAGVGKTALAVHAAHRLAGRFRDGQLFVDLHGHTADREPLSADAALDLLLRAAGLPDESIPKNLDEKAARWRAELAERRILVVLDNASSSAQVRPLLPGSASCAVLVTSRRRLVGLDGVEVLSLDTLPEADAVALFHRIAGLDHAREQVADVVRLCGHLPLAIGVVAARFRSRPTWTVEHLLERLRDRRSQPALLEADSYSVAAAFALSYQQLPPDQQRMFRLLGLHPGTDIDWYAAGALAGLPLASARDLLDALCDVHLLVEYLPGRYRLHDLVREYARTNAETDEPEPERGRARDRLLDYYLHVSEIAADLLVPLRRTLGPKPEQPPVDAPLLSQQSEALSWFQAEHGNLLAVARVAVEHSTAEHGWQIPRNAAVYLMRCGSFGMSATVLRTALIAFRPDTDPAARIACRSNLALAYMGLGEYRPALDYLRQSLADACDCDDHASAGVLLILSAVLSNLMGSFAEAATFASRAMRAVRDQADKAREAEALCALVEALDRLGRQHEAVDAARQAAIPAEALANERVEGVLLSRLGTAHSHLDQHDIALSLLTRSVEVARQANDRPSEAAYLHRLAHALRRSGRHREALVHAREALDILQEVADPADLAETHNALGAIHSDLRRYDDALAHYRHALTVADRVGYRIGQAYALDGIGRILHVMGDAADARAHWQQALDTFVELGMPEAEAVRRRLGV